MVVSIGSEALDPIRLENERAYLLALAQVTHIGPVRLQRLRDAFGSLERAWHANEREILSILDERAGRGVVDARSRIDPRRVLEKIDAAGVSVVTVLDDHFPYLLRQIQAPPPVLFYRGTLPEHDDPTVAVVGTRRSTSYGREVTSQVAGDLASAGVCVISGLAKGIDGFAHRAAIERGGRTLAVMASGVDVIYPQEHRQLAQSVMEHGALISEYLPGTKPDAPNFPARNRIVSGLSLATIVIEAPARSGALITASFAGDQGRDVYAVPGSILSAASAGSNKLLRDGATILTSAGDLLDDLGLAAPEETEPSEQMAFPMTDEERSIYALVTAEPQHIDELAYSAGCTIAQASALMTMLELKGLVANAGAQHFVATSLRPRSRQKLPA